MQANFLFRYRILGVNLQKQYTSKRVQMDRLETNFVHMESVYGKRMANFLRGKVTKEAKDQHQKWEAHIAEYKRQQDLEIENTELMMFLNAFHFSEAFLKSDDLVSLTSLKPSQLMDRNRMGFDNVGMQVWFQYIMNFREIINILVTKCQEVVQIVEPFVGARFQKPHSDLIRGLLEGLVGLLNQRITPVKVNSALKCPNPKVTEIMNRMVPIIVKEVNKNLEKSLEINLLELKVANIHAKYYTLIQNREKAYVLLFKAFKQMKGSLEKYVRVFTQYVRLFPILKEYLYDKKRVKDVEEKPTGSAVPVSRRPNSRISRIDLSSPKKMLETPAKRPVSEDNQSKRSYLRQIIEKSSQGSKHSISGRSIDPEIASKISNVFAGVAEQIDRETELAKIRQTAQSSSLPAANEGFLSERVPLVHLVYKLINKPDEENEDLQVKERKLIEESHSLFLWRDVIKHRTKRTVFMQEYVAYFEKILSIDELMEIVETLGNSSMDSGAFPEAIGFYKTLIMLSEVHTKFQIVLNSISEEKELKEERLLKILALNKKIMVVYNKVARAYHFLGDQVSSYLYFVSAMFIYSNSLQMVNDSDPLKYAKKNPNDFLAQEEPDKIEVTAALKHKISTYVMSFNDHYRDTLSILELVGKVVETNFEKFGKDFFLAVKNCIQNIDRMQNFRKRTFMNFMGDIPSKHMDKWMASKGLALLKEIHSIYVGMLEPLDIDQFVEIWIQLEVQKYLEQNPDKPLAQNLKPGKLNRTKVRFFYDFDRQDIEWLQQAFTFAIFSAELKFVELLEFQSIKKGRTTTLGDLIKNSSNRLLSGKKLLQTHQPSNFNFFGMDSLLPEGPVVPPAQNSTRSIGGSGVPGKPGVQRTLVGFHIPNLLTERIKVVESPQDLSARIINNLVRDQLVKMCRILRYFRERRSKIRAIASKASRGELYLMRNTGGNKIKQRLERTEKHKDPDDLIGIYLRQQRSCETFRIVGNLVHNSRFYREASESIGVSKVNHQLFDYRDHVRTVNNKLFADISIPNLYYSFDPKYLPAVERGTTSASGSVSQRDKSLKHKITKVSDSDENGYVHSNSLTQKDNLSRQTTFNRGINVRFADEDDLEAKSGIGAKGTKSGSNPLTRVEVSRGYLDILNLLNFTKYFYEEQFLRKIRNPGKRRELQKRQTLAKDHPSLDLTHSNLTKTYSQGGRRDETSKGTKTVVQIEDVDNQIVPTIEDSIPELCNARFQFMIPYYGVYEPVVITFQISLRKIVFVLHFTKNALAPIRTVFELDLTEDLWILKEKFLLGKNPEMVKTYNPIVFDTLLRMFFLPTFKFQSHLNQAIPKDTNRLEFEHQLMGLAFPIALTRLSGYEVDLLRKTAIFQEFTKADLDNLQALLKVIIYLARIIRTCALNSPRGMLTTRKFNILELATPGSVSLSLFNTKHLLNYKVTQLNKAFQQKLKEQFTHTANNKTTDESLDKCLNLDNLVTLLEKLYYTTDFLKSFCKMTHTPLRYGEQRKDFDMFVARHSFQDEFGTFHHLDMSMKVVSHRLEQSTKQIKQLYHDTVKSATSQNGPKLSNNQLMILVFFLILENSLVFYLRIDSGFREIWMRVFARAKSSILKKPSKSETSLSKLILEMPPPNLSKPQQSYISLSEFYHLYRSFESGVPHLKMIDQDTNFVLEDLVHNPSSLFGFLMKLTTSPFKQQVYVDFLTKLTAEILREQTHLLQKSRSFYHVTSYNSETTLKASNFFYFRYDCFKEYTQSIHRPMRKLLETFSSNAAGPKSYSLKFFNTFVKLYSMAFNTNDDSGSRSVKNDLREIQYQKLSESKPRTIRVNQESPWEDGNSGQGLMQEANQQRKTQASVKPQPEVSHFTTTQSLNIMQALSGIVMTPGMKTYTKHQTQLEEAFSENFREVMRTIPKSKTVAF